MPGNNMACNCPVCGQAVPSADINKKSSIAKCPGCGLLFSAKDAPPFLQKPEIEKPDRFYITRQCADTVISYRWFPFFKTAVLLFYCVVVNGFTGFIAYETLVHLRQGLILGFPLLFVSFGVWFAYFTAAGVMNRTHVRVSPGGITIRSAPVPWPGDIAFLKQDLVQLFCRQTITRKGHKRYTLNAIMRDGSNLELLSRFESQEEALFIEQRIEAALAITDQPVAGEMTLNM